MEVWEDISTRQLTAEKPIIFFSGRKTRTISTNRSPLAQFFEHASIYSPSIRSPSWERKWIRFNGDRSPVCIYIYYGASDHSSNLERDHARVTSQLFGPEVFSFVFFNGCLVSHGLYQAIISTVQQYPPTNNYTLHLHDHLTTTIHDLNLQQ